MRARYRVIGAQQVHADEAPTHAPHMDEWGVHGAKYGCRVSEVITLVSPPPLLAPLTVAPAGGT